MEIALSFKTPDGWRPDDGKLLQLVTILACHVMRLEGMMARSDEDAVQASALFKDLINAMPPGALKPTLTPPTAEHHALIEAKLSAPTPEAFEAYKNAVADARAAFDVTQATAAAVALVRGYFPELSVEWSPTTSPPEQPG